MSKASLTMNVKGVDSTKAAFDSVAWRGRQVASKLRGMLGGALAAAGAYLGIHAITAGINELGKLSDMAASCATSTDDLTKTMLAMQVVGVNTDLSTLTRTFAKIQKETGEVGMDGFVNQLKRLAEIEDPAERAQEAMKRLGRSGADFLKVINAGGDAIDSLFAVANAMPVIPQAAADAGDAVADAMSIASAGVKSVWLQGLATISGWFDKNFKGGIRQASAEGAAYLEYYAKVGVQKALAWWEKITTYFEAVGTFWGTLFGTEGSVGERFEAALQAYDDELEQRADYVAEVEAKTEERINDWAEVLEAKVEKIEKLQAHYDKASRVVGAEIIDAADEAAEKLSKVQVRNDLVIAGTNAATKLALLGPNYKDEQKKTNALLSKIAPAVERIANKSEKSTVELGEVDL